MKKVKLGDLTNAMLNLPTIAEQRRFVAFVKQTDKSKYHSEITYRMGVAA